LNLHLSASFRVNVDNLTNSWKLKPINRYELVEMEKKIKRHNFNDRSTSIESLEKLDLTKLEVKRKMSTSNINYLKNIDSKKRSSSTSYLTNDEDDCDDVYYPDEDVIKFRRQLSLDARLNEACENNQIKKNNYINEQNENSPNMKQNDSSLHINNRKNDETSDTSSSSSEENSDFSENDENDYLYSIDEGIESLKDSDIDSRNLIYF
jgi:hypothetical protein